MREAPKHWLVWDVISQSVKWLAPKAMLIHMNSNLTSQFPSVVSFFPRTRKLASVESLISLVSLSTDVDSVSEVRQLQHFIIKSQKGRINWT